MQNTTLVYLERDNQYLMLHRIKKENDINHDKWIGVGGKFEQNESPEECAVREVYEETGFMVHDLKYRGIVTFVSDACFCEYMHLFTSENFSGTMKDCDEGVLKWVDKSEVVNLPLWEGDKIFLKLLSENAPFFSLKLVYEKDLLKNSTCYLYETKVK